MVINKHNKHFLKRLLIPTGFNTLTLKNQEGNKARFLIQQGTRAGS